MSSQTPRDFTPESGGPTDVSPLGRTGNKPSHELTAEEERGGANWDMIAADADFKKLLASKIRFILPMTIFFLVYYFALPVLVGWAPDFMKTKVGSVNVAVYLRVLAVLHGLDRSRHLRQQSRGLG